MLDHILRVAAIQLLTLLISDRLLLLLDFREFADTILLHLKCHITLRIVYQLRMCTVVQDVIGVGGEPIGLPTAFFLLHPLVLFVEILEIVLGLLT